MDFDTVVHHMTDRVEPGTERGKPGTIVDFLSLAGLHADRLLWEKVKLEVETKLLPGKALSDLVGAKVFPQIGRKKPEKWAKGRNLTPMKVRHTTKWPRSYLYAPIMRIIAISNSIASGPRKLSLESIEALGEVADIDVSREDAGRLLAVIRLLLGDNRELKHIVDILESTKEAVTQTAEINSALYQRMLTHDGKPAYESTTPSAANGKDTNPIIN